MKLVRYGPAGREKPGLIDAQGKLRDLSAHIQDITPGHLNDKALAKLARIKNLSVLKWKATFNQLLFKPRLISALRRQNHV